jgi:glutamate--cysteine ligase
MSRDFGNSFSAFVLDASRRHREHLLALPYEAAVQQRFERMAAESIDEQKAIEAADAMDFETYRQHYLAGTLPISP